MKVEPESSEEPSSVVEIDGELGRGSFAVVFRAKSENGEPLALKKYMPNLQSRELFERDALHGFALALAMLAPPTFAVDLERRLLLVEELIPLDHWRWHPGSAETAALHCLSIVGRLAAAGLVNFDTKAENLGMKRVSGEWRSYLLDASSDFTGFCYGATSDRTSSQVKSDFKYLAAYIMLSIMRVTSYNLCADLGECCTKLLRGASAPRVTKLLNKPPYTLDLFGKPLNVQHFFEERLRNYRHLLPADLPILSDFRLPYSARDDLLRKKWGGDDIAALPSKGLRALFEEELKTSIRVVGRTKLRVGLDLGKVAQVYAGAPQVTNSQRRRRTPGEKG
jgi:hypothetical protein